jgi:hypothetical protein
LQLRGAARGPAMVSAESHSRQAGTLSGTRQHRKGTAEESNGKSETATF